MYIHREIRIDKLFPITVPGKIPVQQTVYKRLMSKLLHSANLTEGFPVFESIVKLTSLKYKTPDHDEIIAKNADKKKQTDPESNKSSEVQSDEQVNEDANGNEPKVVKDEIKDIKDNEKRCSQRASSSYYRRFKKKLKRVMQEWNDKCSDRLNPFFAPSYMKYLIDYALPYYPLWSASGIIRRNKRRNDNSTIENTFRIQKRIRFKRTKRFRDLFVEIMNL